MFAKNKRKKRHFGRFGCFHSGGKRTNVWGENERSGVLANLPCLFLRWNGHVRRKNEPTLAKITNAVAFWQIRLLAVSPGFMVCAAKTIWETATAMETMTIGTTDAGRPP